MPGATVTLHPGYSLDAEKPNFDYYPHYSELVIKTIMVFIIYLYHSPIYAFI
jgi:hypothetical protein